MQKTVSLKKNYEFMRLYNKGKFFAGKYLVLYVMKNRRTINRIGITANKKVGKSVKRNRLRRLVKECYRIYEPRVKDGFDLVFVVRSSEIFPGFKEVQKEMKFLMKKLDIFLKESDDVKTDTDGNGEILP